MPYSILEDVSASGSEDEDDLDSQPEVEKRPEIGMEGTLSKWTNYIHGWQNRYFLLTNGNLLYYKSEFDTAYGCRGSVSVGKAKIEVSVS